MKYRGGYGEDFQEWCKELASRTVLQKLMLALKSGVHPSDDSSSEASESEGDEADYHDEDVDDMDEDED